MKIIVILLVITLFSCKAKTYRIEQYRFYKGKCTGGTMWHVTEKSKYNVYSVKMVDGFNPDYGFDSVVFKIVETQ